MDTGIFGSTLEAACSYVFLFIIFGGFLSGFGGGDVFIELANGLAGRYRGGPAKVAVLSSALLGTIVGNAIANVATTGSFTIPLMKKVGYRPAFAGAVEAAASTGGQIMPPVMGAVAFVMAEMVGLQYSRIALAAAIPAVLYFFSVLIMVDCEAARYGLNGEDPARLPNVRMLLRRKWAYLFPIVVIFVALLGFGVSTSRAALLGIATTLIIPFVARGTDISLKKCIDALAVSGRDILSIIAACAVAGIIIGVLGLTGLGSKIGMLMMAVAHGNLLIMLIASMIFSIILGMGMPTVAAYIVAASVVAPPLVQAGLPMLPRASFHLLFRHILRRYPACGADRLYGCRHRGSQPQQHRYRGFQTVPGGIYRSLHVRLQPCAAHGRLRSGNLLRRLHRLHRRYFSGFFHPGLVLRPAAARPADTSRNRGADDHSQRYADRPHRPWPAARRYSDLPSTASSFLQLLQDVCLETEIRKS